MADPAEVLTRHTKSIGDSEAWCRACQGDWPCDAAQLAKEIQAFRENGDLHYCLKAARLADENHQLATALQDLERISNEMFDAGADISKHWHKRAEAAEKRVAELEQLVNECLA